MKRSISVIVDFDKRQFWTPEERAAELDELVRSASVEIVRQVIVRAHEPSSASLIGSGKAEELSEMCRAEKVDVVIFDNDLTASQQNNLERAIGVKVIDRTQLILDIFARRAHSNEGKLQVELARSKYMLTRIMDQGLQMSRTGGGIGTSGPGEQKLEVDRRIIKARVAKLVRELQGLRERRGMMRTKRLRYSLPSIAIVGYTNAGKSTLINAMTGSHVTVRDKLFATLDPTIRQYVMPNNQKVLFIDTVGFIKALPHSLVEAFKATLEEASEADLLLHVVDASHPKALEQAESALGVLKEIGAVDKPTITVLNKVDKVKDRSIVEYLKERFQDPVAISALNGEGFDSLISRILHYTGSSTVVINIRIPDSDGKTLNLIHESGIVRKQEYRDGALFVEAEVPIRIKGILEKQGLLHLST